MAMETSTEALESANELLKQSEDLRQMLDNILEKVKTKNKRFSELNIFRPIGN